MMEKIGDFLFRYRNGLFPVIVVLMLLDRNHLFDRYWMVVAVGVVVAFSGQLLRALTIGLAYIIRGGKKRRVYAKDLVTEGMFAHCRNPLYLGNILIVAGLSLIANSPLMLFVGLPFFIFAYHAITRAEERFLGQKFGPQYQAYCNDVPRFLIRFSGLPATLHGMTFNWRRLLLKEYGTTYTWLASTLFLILRDDYLSARHLHEHLLFSVAVAFIIISIAYGAALYVKKNKLIRAD